MFVIFVRLGILRNFDRALRWDTNSVRYRHVGSKLYTDNKKINRRIEEILSFIVDLLNVFMQVPAFGQVLNPSYKHWRASHAKLNMICRPIALYWVLLTRSDSSGSY